MKRDLDLYLTTRANHLSPIDYGYSHKDSINDLDKNLLRADQIDLNQDGTTDQKDYRLLFDSIYKNEDNSIVLTDAQKQLADRDNNGTIDVIDLYNVRGIISQNIYDSINPSETQKGDLNNDGKIDQNDIGAFTELNYATLGLIVDRTPAEEMVQAADFNGDGILNGDDLQKLESLVEKKEDPEHIKPLSTEKLLGDFNFDGSVDYDDVEILGNSLSRFTKKDKLTDEQRDVADMNQDGKVDSSDMMTLSYNIFKSLLSSIKPGSGLNGDMNNDGNIDKKDEWTYIIASDIVRNHPEISLGELFPVFDLNHDGRINKKDYNVLHYDLLKNEKPIIPSPTKTDPNNWMVSQNKGPTNLNEDKPFFNGNCGVTSLLMVARMFGKIGGGAEEANEQIELMRELMGATTSEYEGSSMMQVSDGARSLGLNAKATHSDINDIVSAIKHGKKVIAGVDPKKYGPTTTSIGHAVVISDFDGEKFTVYDPGFQKPIKLTKQQLELALNDKGINTAIIGKIPRRH